jgi:hypothetical protein
MADEQVKRLYSGISDTKMFNEAQTIHNLLDDDLADFTAKDAAFNLDFLEDFQTKINDCIAFKTDETYMDEVEQLTKNVMQAWENCKNYFQDMKYYIEKAFPNDPAIHKQFGYDDYRDMSRLQDKVVPFMESLKKKAADNMPALLAAGMTAAQIDQINLLKNAFNAANGTQDEAIKRRLELTQMRIELNNSLWKILQQINKLSKAVYRGNYAKLQQYLLPAAGTNEREFLALTGTVLNASNNEPIEDALVELPALSLTATTDATGRYGFTQEIPAGPTLLRVSASGFITFEVTVTIVDGTLVEQDVSLAVA